MTASLALAIPLETADGVLLFAELRIWRAGDRGRLDGLRYWPDEITTATEHFAIDAVSGALSPLSPEEFQEATLAVL